MLRVISDIFVDSVIGAFMDCFRKCTNGVCSLTSNFYHGAVYGAVRDYYQLCHKIRIIKRCNMPMYTYICEDCGEKFDLLIGVTSKKTQLKCKKCNSANIKKTFGSFSVGTSGPDYSSGSSCSTGMCPTCPTCS